MPPAPTTTRATPFNMPLLDLEGEEEQEEGEGEDGWEDEEHPDPAPLGQFQAPVVSTTTRT